MICSPLHELALRFLSPDGAERSEAALLRRLDRMNKHMERLEREAQVGNEALAIFIRTWLGTTPLVSAADEPATRALGQKRYGNFIHALSRRLTSGTSLADQAFEPGEQTLGGDEPPER